MKKCLIFLFVIIAMISVSFPVIVSADIPKEKLDALSEGDKASLSSILRIAILTKKAGVGGSKYSDVLEEDLSNYTVEELEEIEEYLNGNASYGAASEDAVDGFVNAIICSYKLFSIKVVGVDIKAHKYTDDIDLVLSVEMNNGNDFDYEGYIDTVTVNGWQVDKLAWFNIKAGNKMNDDFTIKIKDIDIHSLDEIESFSISFKLLYAQYYAVTDTVELKLK